MADRAPILTTDLAGIELATPILLAAGTAGTLDELAGVVPLDCVGTLVTKSITREPRAGNETWRILESRVGMLNAIGLANPGIDRFIDEYAPRLGGVPTNVFVSVAGATVDDYVDVASRLDGVTGAGAIELNVSCPNVKTGLDFGRSGESLAELVREVRAAVRSKKLFVKLSPMMTDPVEVASGAVDAGADALTVANTVPAMEIDVASRKPRLANVTGGLSGPAIHPIAVRLVHTIYRGVCKDAKIPIIGAGGVTGWRDAAQMILAGATCVQLGTVLFADPRAPRKVARGLTRWAKSHQAPRVSDLTGAVRLD